MNAETTIRTIPDDCAGQRLDQALAKLFPEYSRSRLKAWLLSGAIHVDGESPRPRDAVHGGETVALCAEPEVSVVADPEPIALAVVHEDDAFLRAWSCIPAPATVVAR
jgi:23S rRNA pseudouridine1911/1915/1917 synthase